MSTPGPSLVCPGCGSPVDLRRGLLCETCAPVVEPQPDDREPLGRIVHETRLAFNAGLKHPRGIGPWEERHESQRELDMRMGKAVRDAVLTAAPAGGELVRETWVNWALEQDDVAGHPNWVKPWAELDERDREVDDRIYSAVAAKAVHDAGLDLAAARKRIMQLEAELRQVLDRDKISDEEGTGNG